MIQAIVARIEGFLPSKSANCALPTTKRRTFAMENILVCGKDYVTKR
jgi:hypothetical protein